MKVTRKLARDRLVWFVGSAVGIVLIPWAVGLLVLKLTVRSSPEITYFAWGMAHHPHPEIPMYIEWGLGVITLIALVIILAVGYLLYDWLFPVRTITMKREDK